MESDGNRLFVTHGIRRRPATVPSTEIDGNLLVRHVNESITIISVTILVAIAITILTVILKSRRGERSKCDEQKNCGDKDRSNARESPLRHMLLLIAIRTFHDTPL